MPRKATKTVKRDTSGTARTRKQSTDPESQKTGDSTARVSVKPQPSQKDLGPSPKDLRSRKRSSDTRGSKESGTKSRPRRGSEEWPHGKPAQEQVPTAAETAAKQPIRQDDRPAPAETLKVKGEKVDVIAVPGRVDPIELKPSKRDTLIKDTLRTNGDNQHADAPVRTVEGGQWVEQDVKVT